LRGILICGGSGDAKAGESKGGEDPEENPKEGEEREEEKGRIPQ